MIFAIYAFAVEICFISLSFNKEEFHLSLNNVSSLSQKSFIFLSTMFHLSRNFTTVLF